MRNERVNGQCNWSETHVTLESHRTNASARRVPAANLRGIFTEYFYWQRPGSRQSNCLLCLIFILHDAYEFQQTAM